MALAFTQPVDVVNRAGQHLGVNKITAAQFQAANPVVKLATEAQTCYDKLRVAELERNTWTFSTSRAVLRSLTPTTQLWTPAAWSNVTAYNAFAIVSRGGDFYVSSAATTGADPLTNSPLWTKYFGVITLDTYDAETSYFAGELTVFSGLFYMSIQTGNEGNEPDTSPLFWMVVGGTAAVIQIIYPIGVGPSSQSSTANAYRLPYGFLRRAPDQPHVAMSPVGGPAYNGPDDWLFEGSYLLSSDPGPIVLRCVIDITDVSLMSPMFCEGHAARMAKEMCEALTQATDKQATAERAYKLAMAEARQVDAIEQGAIDPIEDTYLLVRL